jgi:hypothetical protein
MNISKLFIVAAVATLASASQAIIIISNLQFAPLGSGAALSASGNSVSFSAAAAVGDTLPSRYQIFTYQYDARSTGALINGITLNFAGEVRGSGRITVQEDIYQLDNAGNEVGGVAQSFIQSVGEGAGVFVRSTPLDFNGNYRSIRVKKTIILNAINNTNGTDLAALGYANQSVEVVPEPASMLALAGAAAMVARRWKNK